MKNFIQCGDTITAVAPYAVASGAPFKVGALLAVAVYAAEAGAQVEGKREGVFSLPKLAAQAWSAGDKVYWDDTNKVMTTVASGNTLAGVATEAAANPSSTGVALLDGCVR